MPHRPGSLLNDHLELVSARNDPDLDDFQLQAIIKETPGAAQALLETEGYFTPLSGWRSRASITMIKVEPGEPVIIDDVTLQLNGDIRQQADYQQRLAAVLEAWSLPIGHPTGRTTGAAASAPSCACSPSIASRWPASSRVRPISTRKRIAPSCWWSWTAAR
jgi:translocation and assembly module TamA